MTVYAGSVIIEPGLTHNDFIELKKKGVWLAKAGFGNVKSADEYIELVKNAKQAGLLTTLHTGGASIPGSFPITGNDLININPDVSFHINGGPVSIDDKYFKIISKDTDIFMQVCTAGNLRTAIICANEAYQNNVFERFLIATDTPTGSGIMPLGIIYTISQISSLSKLSPELLIAAATGNVAKAYGINSGFIKRSGYYLFALRMCLIFPYFMINLVSGLTTIRTPVFYIVSQIGMLPGTIIIILLGSNIAHSITSNIGIGIEMILLLSILGILPLLSRYIFKQWLEE